MKRLGRPLPLSPDDVFNVPSKKEVDSAIVRWNANCHPFYVGLLGAEPIEKENGTSRFIFDGSRNLYILRRTGRVIPRREIMQAFSEYLRKLA